MSQLAPEYLSHNDSGMNAPSLNNNQVPDLRDIHFYVLAFLGPGDWIPPPFAA